MKEITDYRVLAAAFAPPSATLLAALREIPAFRNSLSQADLEELRKEHLRLFTPTVAGGLPPYETEYGKLDVFLKSQIMADIAGFYRAFGLDLSESAHERVDFISAELEFLHWLSLKEERAGEKNDRGNEALCREARKNFLQDHLGRWASFLGGQIAREAQHPFYAELGRSLGRFVRSECRRLGVEPEPVSGWAPEPDLADELTCGGDAGPGEDGPVPQSPTVWKD